MKSAKRILVCHAVLLAAWAFVPGGCSSEEPVGLEEGGPGSAAVQEETGPPVETATEPEPLTEEGSPSGGFFGGPAIAGSAATEEQDEAAMERLRERNRTAQRQEQEPEPAAMAGSQSRTPPPSGGGDGGGSLLSRMVDKAFSLADAAVTRAMALSPPVFYGGLAALAILLGGGAFLLMRKSRTPLTA